MSFFNPDSILPTIGIFQPGMEVAEFGCGAGYFILPLARLVGEGGRVFAVDVQQSALESTKRRASRQGISNIELVRADLEKLGSTGIPHASLDAVLIANTLYQSEQKSEILKEAGRVLKQPGGFLVIIDWEPSALFVPKEGSFAVSKDQMKELALKTGFTFQKDFSVDPYHYGLLFRL